MKVEGLVNVGHAALEVEAMPLKLMVSEPVAGTVLVVCVYVQVPPRTCTPTMLIVHEPMKNVTSTEQLKGASRMAVPDADEVGVELVDLRSMFWPAAQVTLAGKLPLVVLAVQVPPTPKSTPILADRPSAAMVPVAVEVVQDTESSLPLSVSRVLVDLPETLAPAGVSLACAGAARTASEVSMAIARRLPRVIALFIASFTFSGCETGVETEIVRRTRR